MGPYIRPSVVEDMFLQEPFVTDCFLPTLLLPNTGLERGQKGRAADTSTV